MPARLSLFVGVAVLALSGAWVIAEWAGPVGISAAVAGCSVLAVISRWRVGRAQAHRLAIAAGSVSLVTTVYVLASDTTIAAGRNLGPVELIALYALLAAVARWTTPLRMAVVSCALLWTACVAWILRLVNYSPADPSVAIWPISSGYDLVLVTGNLAAGALLPTAAALAGGLPRYLAQRRRELASAVRHRLRLEQARDLHDFVARDLTGMVAQAQAARLARADDAEHLRRLLEQIEHVGVAALHTMDGFASVRVERDDDVPTDHS